jgi:hypothetical protein
MWMVPQLPHADGAELWFSSFAQARPSPRVGVDVESVSGVRRATLELDWCPVATHSPRMWVARARVDGLAANHTYTLWLRPGLGRRYGAPAVVRTLPQALPGPQAWPFTVFLGSCFDYRGEGASGVGELRRLLSDERLPHLKLLCGDQIYLDLPVFQDIPSRAPAAYGFALGKYLRNWAPRGTQLANGYGDFLRHGANLFVSDDHEFWNNYPFAASHLPCTYTAASRQRLGGIAAALYRGFQARCGVGDGRRALQEITLGTPGEPGSLEIYAIDGRLERAYERAHWPADVEELCARLRRLRAPAVVVLSQPLFEPAVSGLRRRWVDAGIPDFRDYEPLVHALDDAPHDVLVLSGDIHCGRIAVCQAARGRSKIVEVVASPLSLIPGTSFADAPAHAAFPSRPLRGGQVPSRPVETVFGPLKGEHAATLQFHAKDRAVEVEVAYWGVRDRRLLARPWRVTLH